MKPSIILIITAGIVSCKNTDNSISNPDKPAVEHNKSNILSPKDLNIDKQQFLARPSDKQVAIFRAETINNIDPRFSQSYDQIFWRKNGQEVEVNVVVAPLSFYNGYPEPDKEDEKTFFRDSWSISAGMFSYDVEEFSFVSSAYGSSNLSLSLEAENFESGIERSTATGEIAYSKNSDTHSKDLEFKFTMFILSLEEAKKMHPELKIECDDSTTSWNAAYINRKKQNKA